MKSRPSLPTIGYGPMVFLTGVAGGVFFFAGYQFMTFFSFIKKSMLRPEWVFLDDRWQGGAVDHFLWLASLVIVSVIWAYSYSFLAKGIETLWIGAGVNALLFTGFCLLRYWNGSFADAGWNSVIGAGCLIVLHGAFTGYSISYKEPYNGQGE